MYDAGDFSDAEATTMSVNDAADTAVVGCEGVLDTLATSDARCNQSGERSTAWGLEMQLDGRQEMA